jgi:hypothetical protein
MGGVTLIHNWWECILIHPQWKSVWKFFQKLKIELAYHYAVPPLGMYLKECKLYTIAILAQLCLE